MKRVVGQKMEVFCANTSFFYVMVSSFHRFLLEFVFNTFDSGCDMSFTEREREPRCGWWIKLLVKLFSFTWNLYANSHFCHFIKTKHFIRFGCMRDKQVNKQVHLAPIPKRFSYLLSRIFIIHIITSCWARCHSCIILLWINAFVMKEHFDDFHTKHNILTAT